MQKMALLLFVLTIPVSAIAGDYGSLNPYVITYLDFENAIGTTAPPPFLCTWVLLTNFSNIEPLQ